MRTFYIIVIIVTAALFPAGDDNLKLGGYLESKMNYFDGKSEVTSSNALFRLEGNYDISDKGKIEAHLLYYYNLQPLDPFHTFKEGSIYYKLINTYFNELYGSLDPVQQDVIDELMDIYSSGYFSHISYSSFYPKETLVLDRALIKLYFDSADLVFGKQQIAWGTGYAFNPTDVWNIKDPLNAEAAKIGVLAANLSFYFGENSSLQVISSPGSDFDHWKYGARFKSTAGRFEYSFSGIRDKTDDGELLGIPEKLQMGADLSGEIVNEIGIHAEAAFFNPRYNGMEMSDTDSSYVQITAGFDYTFNNGLYILGEYYFNGLGEKSYKDYDLQTFTRLSGGEMSGLAQNYSALVLSYIFLDDYTASILNIVNLDDVSSVLIPGLEYSFHENISIKINSNIFIGDSETTEYGGIFNSVTFSVTGFF